MAVARRPHLFRWYRHWQLDAPTWPVGWLSLGFKSERRSGTRFGPWRPVAYWSPDATPLHPQARGIGR